LTGIKHVQNMRLKNFKAFYNLIVEVIMRNNRKV